MGDVAALGALDPDGMDPTLRQKGKHTILGVNEDFWLDFLCRFVLSPKKITKSF